MENFIQEKRDGQLVSFSSQIKILSNLNFKRKRKIIQVSNPAQYFYLHAREIFEGCRYKIHIRKL